MKKTLEILSKNWKGILVLLFLGIVIYVLIKKKGRKILSRREREREKVEVNINELPKSEEIYKSLAVSIYKALKGLGTDEEKLVPLRYLTNEELKMVFNAYNDVLIEKGDTEDGNIIDWLIDDGEEGYAALFMRAGLQPAL